MPLSLPHGLHRNYPAERYHARVPALASKGALDHVRKAPAVYKAWLEGHEKEDTAAFAFGRAFHCALLEPDVFATTYAVEPDFGDCRTKANRTARDTWREQNSGRVLLSERDASMIAPMIAAVRAHPLASRMLQDGVPELTLRWRDEETGIECKARADHYVERLRLVVDVKTCDDASREGFRKSAAKYGYARQAAFYDAGFAALGEELEHFLFLCVEKERPHLVGLYNFDEDGMARGFASICEDLETLAWCLERDEWPGLPTSITTVDLPPWAI